MIVRTNPAVDYLTDDVFDAFAFRQSVRAGDTYYYAGVAPLAGSLTALELIGKDDMAAQLAYVLRVIDDCLRADGLDREDRQRRRGRAPARGEEGDGRRDRSARGPRAARLRQSRQR